jgi:hypothetical protein
MNCPSVDLAVFYLTRLLIWRQLTVDGRNTYFSLLYTSTNASKKHVAFILTIPEYIASPFIQLQHSYLPPKQPQITLGTDYERIVLSKTKDIKKNHENP